MFSAALYHPFETVRGIEILDNLVELANDVSQMRVDRVRVRVRLELANDVSQVRLVRVNAHVSCMRAECAEKMSITTHLIPYPLSFISMHFTKGVSRAYSDQASIVRQAAQHSR